MSCPACAERVVVKVNERGTLGFSCDECGEVGYAKEGQGNRALWLKRIEKSAPAAPAAVAPATPKPAASKPSAKPSGLDL